MIKKGDSLDKLLSSTAALLSNPINPNPNSTTDSTGITSQNPSNTFSFETKKKMSPNPRALGPVKFAKSQEVELLWLETVKARFVIELKRFLSFYTVLQITGRFLFILSTDDYCYITLICVFRAANNLPLETSHHFTRPLLTYFYFFSF